MKRTVKISKSSDYSANDCPYPGARKVADCENPQSEYDYHWEFDISSLEDLIEIMDNTKHSLVLSMRKDRDLEVEIYDSYRE